MPKVTEHLTSEEFACHDGNKYPDAWVADRLIPLCNALEIIRAEIGGHPMTILSGYRSPEHNAAVGGASASQHMEGRAADITIAAADPRAAHDVILRLYEQGKIQIGGLGSYAGWVHVDIRHNADGRLRRWRL